MFKNRIKFLLISLILHKWLRLFEWSLMGAVGQWRFIFIPARASNLRDVEMLKIGLKLTCWESMLKFWCSNFVNTWDMECPS